MLARIDGNTVFVCKTIWPIDVKIDVLHAKIESLIQKVEALEAKVEIKGEIVRSECAGLYMEMADGKKRTSRLEEYTRVLDKHPADEPVHYTGGAFGDLSLLEQHRMQQRGSEY